MLTHTGSIPAATFPTVSIIIPVYNSERTLKECLSSIAKQEFPKQLVEVIVVDGGSTDSTLQIAKEMPDVKIASNKLRTGEAGKAVGARLARNEILAFVDSDNILEGPLWLQKMTRPFSEPNIVASEPLYFTHRHDDPAITRYCALIGANDPLTVYIGNYDRYSYLKKRWTEVPVRQEDSGQYLSIELRGAILPTFGANGFLVLRKLVQGNSPRSFLFDIDFVQSLTAISGLKIAKVKVGIIHLFASGINLFMHKSYRRIRDYSFYTSRGARTYPWGNHSRVKLLKFILSSLLVVPMLRDAGRGYREFPDRAWLIHPIACFLILSVYATCLATKPKILLSMMGTSA
jgi:glycosyltransferase involved in cell wall biosynthesis